MKRPLVLLALFCLAAPARAESGLTAEDKLVAEAQDVVAKRRCGDVDAVLAKVGDGNGRGAALKSAEARVKALAKTCTPSKPEYRGAGDAGVASDGGTKPVNDAGATARRDAGTRDAGAPAQPTSAFGEQEAEGLLKQVFPALVAETRASWESCKGDPACPPAKLREQELAWLTIHLAVHLPAHRRAELQAAFVAIVIVPQPSVGQALGALQGKTLTPEQREGLLQLVGMAGRDPQSLEKVRAVADKVDVLRALAAVLNLCVKSGCTAEDMNRLGIMKGQMLDPQRRQVLQATLQALQAYPLIRNEAKEAYDRLRENDPSAEQLVLELFSAVGPATIYRIQLEAESRNRIPVAPEEMRFIPLTVVRERGIPGKCSADDQFVTAYRDFLHYSLVDDRGFPPERPVDRDSAAAVRATKTQFGNLSLAMLAGQPRPDHCAFSNVCTTPLPGTILLAITHERPDSFTVEGTCWSDPRGDKHPSEQLLFTTEVSAGCDDAQREQRRAQAVRFAIDPTHRCSLLRPGIRNDDVRPYVRKRAAHAMYFAGAPYLQDARARTWSKVVPSLLDAMLLVAAGVSFGMSFKYRNDYAAGADSAIVRADNFLHAGIGLSIGLLGMRAASAGFYACETCGWRSPHDPSQ